MIDTETLLNPDIKDFYICLFCKGKFKVGKIYFLIVGRDGCDEFERCPECLDRPISDTIKIRCKVLEKTIWGNGIIAYKVQFIKYVEVPLG